MPIFTQWLKEQAMPGRLREIDKGEYTPPTPSTAVSPQPSQPPTNTNILSRMQNALRSAKEKTGEAIGYASQGFYNTLGLGNVVEKTVQARNRDLANATPEQQKWLSEYVGEPTSFLKSPEEATKISPTAAGISSTVGGLAPYLAGAGIEAAGTKLAGAGLARVAPKLAASAVGKAAAKSAGQAALFGSVASLEEAVRNLTDGQKANLKDSLKYILASTGEGALFGAGQELIGPPLKNIAAKTIPTLSKSGFIGGAARAVAGGLTDIAGGSPVIALHAAQSKNPAQTAAQEAAFLGGLGAVHGALGGSADYAARIRRINEAKGYAPKVEQASQQAEAEIAARRAELQKAAETPAETPQTTSESTPVAEPSPVTAEAPGAVSEAPKEPWQMTRAQYEGTAAEAPADFAGSKHPEAVYHGSGTDAIEQFFTTSKDLGGNTGAKSARLGAFFSEDPSIAFTASYGFSPIGVFDSKRSATIYEARLNMRNPLEVNQLTERQVSELDQRMPGFKAAFDKAQAKGEMFGVVSFLSRYREPKPAVGNFSEWAAEHGIPATDVERLWKENAPAFQEWRKAFDEWTASEIEPAAARALQEMGYDGIVVNTVYDTVNDSGPKKQYIVFRPEDIAISRKYPAVSHRQWVEWAVQNGKPVPPEVLADYPDLQTSAQATAPAEATPDKATTTPVASVSETAPSTAQLDTAWTRDLKPGDSVSIKGRDGVFTVVEATKDPSLVSLKSEGGAELRVGRAALEPVKAAEPAPSLADVEKQLTSQIDQAQGEVTGPAGLSVRMVGDTRGEKTQAPLFASADPEVTRRFEAAQGVPKPPLLERMKTVLGEIKQKATNKYTIPRDRYFANARRSLQSLEKQSGIQSARAVQLENGILLPLKKDPAKYNLFRWATVVNDLSATLESGIKELPFGYTEETLRADKARLDETLLQHPDVAQALETRRTVWASAVKENIDANQAIGNDVSRKLSREDYFRHQVIEKMQEEQRLKGAGKRLSAPKNRGYLKARAGSELDINTDYLEVDTMALAQLMYDTELARTIKVIQSPQYNLMDKLKKDAKKQNDALIRQHFRDMAEETGIDPETAYKQLNVRQAIGFDKLQKLAKDGSLPDDGNWTELIQKIADGSVETPETFPYMAWVLKNAPNTDASMAAATVFKGMRLKANFIRDTLADKFVTWEDLVPEGYTTWQPVPGNTFFSSYSLSEQLGEKLFTDAVTEVSASKKDVHRLLAIGGKRPFYVIRQELADTLNNLKETRPDGWLGGKMKWLLGQWKQVVLTSPQRVVKYNVHNLGSDVDVSIFAPGLWKKLPQAVNDLTHTTFGEGTMSDELAQWFKRGGMESSLSVQEAGAVKELQLFQDMLGKQGWNPKRLWNTYFRGARKFTNAREALLRYSAYLHYLDEVQKSPTGLPKHYGASIPEEVKGLTDPRDKAFVLANDLLGAYDEVSHYGKWLRENLIPFWSFQEINMKRYWRLFRNEVTSQELGRAWAAKNLVALAKVAPGVAARLGTYAVKALGLWAGLASYNHFAHPDLEQELPQDVQAKPHIILGRAPDGQVMYYDRVSSFTDVLEWVGLDNAPQDVKDLLDGKKGVKDMLKEAGLSALNKVAQGLGPQYKVPAELASGKKFYPDISKPSPIRDTGNYLASQAGLGEVYDRAKGLPAKPWSWTQDPSRMVFGYSQADPGESAYFDALDLKSKYLESIGKPSSFGGTTSEKSLALYNMRKAARLGDKEAYRRYLLAYVKAGGTLQGMNTSFRNLDPLAGLNAQEKKGFIDWLNPGDKARLLKANQFYQQMLQNTTEFLR